MTWYIYTIFPIAGTQYPILTMYNRKSLIWLMISGPRLVSSKQELIKERFGNAKLLSSWHPGNRAGEQHKRGRGQRPNTNPRSHLCDPQTHLKACSIHSLSGSQANQTTESSLAVTGRLHCGASPPSTDGFQGHGAHLYQEVSGEVQSSGGEPYGMCATARTQPRRSSIAPEAEYQISR